MAVEMVCMSKYGAFTSVDPDTTKKINVCFVEGMKPAGSQGKVRKHHTSDTDGERKESCEDMPRGADAPERRRLPSNIGLMLPRRARGRFILS
jgi:hypothetical protein